VKSTRNRHILANTLAGLFLGLGVSLIVTLYGRVGWSTTTPDLIIVFGVVLGLGVGLLPVRTTRAPAPKR
jgi:Zn-dependent protease with chaperone function